MCRLPSKSCWKIKLSTVQELRNILNPLTVVQFWATESTLHLFFFMLPENQFVFYLSPLFVFYIFPTDSLFHYFAFILSFFPVWIHGRNFKILKTKICFPFLDNSLSLWCIKLGFYYFKINNWILKNNPKNLLKRTNNLIFIFSRKALCAALSLLQFCHLFLTTLGCWEEKANGIRISNVGMFAAFICLPRGWGRAGANGKRAPQTQCRASKGNPSATWIPFVWGNPITAGFSDLPRAFYAAVCSECLFWFDNPGTNKVSPPALIAPLAAFQFVSVSSELDSLLITPTGSWGWASALPPAGIREGLGNQISERQKTPAE